MRVGHKRSNLHFAVTGTAMVLAWQNFLLMSPNGFTFSGECRRVFLPTKNEDAVIEYARNRFVQKGGQGVEELVQGMTSVRFDGLFHLHLGSLGTRLMRQRMRFQQSS